MADRVSASITIGGTIPPDRTAELCALIAEQGLATEWDGETFTPSDLVDGVTLDLFAPDVSWGIFGALEAWLVQQRLPFVRQSDGFAGSFSGERIVFRGVEAATTESFAIDEAHDIVIDEDTARRLGSFEAIIAHFTAAEFSPGPIKLADAAEASSARGTLAGAMP